ncbi:Hypothetical protein A7982_05340 [Minicystis rosea]|nr:Hypothetical protein A7982_05340 [Minicystis rosea]
MNANRCPDASSRPENEPRLTGPSTDGPGDGGCQCAAAPRRRREDQ